ncbi:NAD-P-binding protein [Vararia minispora EC-137]|uniref:NAD-P-binding protein n=1 Tax=Vararia minispora EC-137 TaxID=1314806 RepID=A0ACB8QYB4_9AGAM|nr:NAD-P-binding protein [Vararia minispora EC-137]
MSGIIGLDEYEAFSSIEAIYPLIDPSAVFASRAFKGRVVLITGASGGIGRSISMFYARAGADLVLVSRTLENLKAGEVEILKEVPGARIELVDVDVVHPDSGTEAVKRTIAVFGRLDILVANAGIPSAPHAPLAEKDPLHWWCTQEVNVRGVFVFIHSALPELVKRKGQIVITSSAVAHLRVPGSSDYIISKHAVNRLAELVSLEYPDVKVYSVHPGVVASQQAREAATSFPAIDPPELMAATAMWLTMRNAEFLSGRFINATWDLNEVVAKKDEVVRENLLVTKLARPARESSDLSGAS